MKKSKKIFLIFATIFFLAMIILGYDISNRTTFPGSKKLIIESLSPSDKVKSDSIKTTKEKVRRKLKRGKKIDASKIDLDDLREKSAENPALISFPHSVGSAIVKPEDKGKIKGRAMAAMKEQTEHQLHQLYEQMQTLVQQANDIKKRVEVSNRIYQAQINFEPVIGHTYYLFTRENGNDMLSMISPSEWGENSPFKTYVGSVRLLSDHTWEVLHTGKS